MVFRAVMLAKGHALGGSIFSCDQTHYTKRRKVKKTIAVVLDTSIFVNPDSRFLFGQTPKDALCGFLGALEDKKHIHCYIPPSVYAELAKFMDKLPPLKQLILINKKPPSSYQTTIPAMLVYEFIEEMRIRINKGLRIAEKYSRKTLQQAPAPREGRD